MQSATCWMSQNRRQQQMDDTFFIGLTVFFPLRLMYILNAFYVNTFTVHTIVLKFSSVLDVNDSYFVCFMHISQKECLDRKNS